MKVCLRDLALSALMLAGSASAGFYSSKSNVIELTARNWDDVVTNTETVLMVEFFAPWCGHCQSLKPVYDEVATAVKGLARLAAIDCDDERNKQICSKQGVKGFPTLKIFRPSSKPGVPSHRDYTGHRKPRDIIKDLADSIPNIVKFLHDPDINEFYKEDNGTAKALLFTDKGITTALWKVLAIDFDGPMKFAQIRDTNIGLVGAYGIEKFPTVVALPGGDKPPVFFDSEKKLSKDNLVEFFSQFAQPVIKPEAYLKPKPADKKKKEKKESNDNAKREEDAKKDAPSSSASSEETEPSEPPKPVKVELPVLSSKEDLVSTCFAKKSKTCVVAVSKDVTDTALLETFGKLNRRGPPFTFQLLTLLSSGALGEEVAKAVELGTELPKVVALNHRGWYRTFKGDPTSSTELLGWLDAVKMGEGAKGSIPESLMEVATAGKEKAKEEAKEEVKEEAREKAEKKKDDDVKDEL